MTTRLTPIEIQAFQIGFHRVGGSAVAGASEVYRLNGREWPSLPDNLPDALTYDRECARIGEEYLVLVRAEVARQRAEMA